jgi:hypothetical protein
MWFFYIITIIALIAFGYFMKDFDLKKYPIYSVSLILMITGTLGISSIASSKNMLSTSLISSFLVMISNL